MPDDKVVLQFENYPVDGAETSVRELVAFGPASDDFAILIELDPSGGPLRITVGNGPTHEDAPRLLGETLHDIADAVADLANNEEYWVALAALSKE